MGEFLFTRGYDKREEKLCCVYLKFGRINASMKLNMRKYRCEEDNECIRQFLRDVFLSNYRREYSWPLYRWDYWRWHVNANIFKFNLEAAVFLWETPDGKLAAVLNPEGTGEAFLQIHPDFRSPELEVSMMSVAETQFATTRPGGKQHLRLWAHANDTLRRDILQKRGYSLQGNPEFQRRRSMEIPISAVPLTEGYTFRSQGDESELPARSWASWKAFHPDEPEEKYQGWEWYRNVKLAPLYQHNLDLVAATPSGEIAAFCTLWFDELTRTAAFEPVGTHPDHQRKGLGKALMTEGLRRVEALGATLVTVNSASEVAGALFASVGFTEYDLSEPWQKEW
jgi:ribosomal protein S18 acetylase RimI-like enzyme